MKEIGERVARDQGNSTMKIPDEVVREAMAAAAAEGYYASSHAARAAGAVFARWAMDEAAREAAAIITELVSALEPFAQALDGDSYEECNGDIWESGAAMAIEFDDLRRARAVLNKVKGGERE